MKLATSSGDFVKYVDSVPAAVELFGGTKFRNVNLELGTLFKRGGRYVIPAAGDPLLEEDAWKRQAEALALAAERAGVTYTTAHSPILNALAGGQEMYDWSVKAIRDSIKICAALGIERIVVHACENRRFTCSDFYRENKRFYGEFFDLMEQHGISVLTENMADGTCTPLSTGRDVRDFTDYVDHPLFAACWDTAHGNLNRKARDEGQYANIVAIGDKLKGLHIADNFGDGPHHHTWPFAGIINFDAVLQGLLDVNYDGVFTFEASYTLLHHKELPYHRQAWEHSGGTVTKLLDPPVALKQKAVDLLYDVGKSMLEAYGCFEA